MNASRDDIKDCDEDSNQEIPVSEINEQSEARNSTDNGKRDGDVIVNIESLLASMNRNLVCKEYQNDDMLKFTKYQGQEEYKQNFKAEKISFHSLKNEQEWETPSKLLEE